LDFFSYSGGVEVLAHIVNGFLVIAFALLIIASSIRLKDSFISKLSLLAIVFVVSAIITGFLYVLGGQNDSFSIAMAMSFIFVYTVYFSELYFIRGKQ
jgi:glucan phosphoethanolaminetransferase (alkaline phosphatase superfamily)